MLRETKLSLLAHENNGKMAVQTQWLVDYCEEARVMLDLKIHNEREFRDLFGESPHTVSVVWRMMEHNQLLPWGAKPVHLLWLLHWYKEYPRQTKMCKFCRCSPNTWIKWRDMMEDAVGFVDVVRRELL